MSPKRVHLCLLLVLISCMLLRGAMAQSSSNCTSTLMTLSSCLSYVVGNTSTPTSSCCSSLGNVVQSQPRCICPLLNNAGVSIGFTINRTLALALPAACSVQTSPLSEYCKKEGNGSATSPSPSPVSSPDDGSDAEPAKTPTTITIPPSIPQETGSKTVPNTSGGTSDGNIIKSPINLAAVALSVTAWVAIGINF